MTTRYRIVAIDEGRFSVDQSQRCAINAGWFGPSHEKWSWCMEPKTFGNPPNEWITGARVIFKDEAEAEQWIKGKLDADAAYEASQARKQAFIDAHPPREVPPYRHLP